MTFLAALLLLAQEASAPPLLPPEQGRAIAAEVSGSMALRTVRTLSQHHRMRGSEGYRAAAEAIRDRLVEYGLDEVGIIALPADGAVLYGTQRSRPAWNARFAELWEGGERIASWAENPVSLAQDSASGRAEADLVDIGAGTAESDYAGKELRGRLVLTSSQPEAVEALAIGRFGAAGIISWAQNQRTAWWGEDERLVRWGHLSSFPERPAFAFMVSPARAHAWRERLRRGERVHLRAEVDAGRSAGAYLIPTAVIPGRDRTREIVYSCHLDHPSPGANDNASGCAGELEAARTLSRLIRSGALPRPERTIRFIWPCEIECTIALLNARPEFVRRTVATIHLDMIGGDTEVTGSILRVEGSPPSLPTAIPEVAFRLARYVNQQSLAYASTGRADMPLVEPDGSRRALQAEIGGFSEGSDHQVWAEGSYRIPVIYLADWPDRYIHTQRDVPENLDPTKMRRAIFIAAASGYYIASHEVADAPRPLASSGPPSGPVYRRVRRDGPMNGFGYSWFDDRLARAGLPRPLLLAREAPYGRASFGYEALNLVDGRRSVGEIRDILAATIAEAPLEEVAQYLDTLARLGVLDRTGG
jgi:aminopeptidase YwaD